MRTSLADAPLAIIPVANARCVSSSGPIATVLPSGTLAGSEVPALGWITAPRHTRQAPVAQIVSLRHREMLLLSAREEASSARHESLTPWTRDRRLACRSTGCRNSRDGRRPALPSHIAAPGRWPQDVGLGPKRSGCAQIEPHPERGLGSAESRPNPLAKRDWAGAGVSPLLSMVRRGSGVRVPASALTEDPQIRPFASPGRGRPPGTRSELGPELRPR
jgi:hypothetical protein